MRTLLVLSSVLALVFAGFNVNAADRRAEESQIQSTITEAEGYSCMGEDKSRKQTRREALVDAKRKAAEFAMTYIKSETKVKDFQLEKDIIDAYARANVRVIEMKERGWYRDELSGECFKVWIKAEVIPDKEAMSRIAGHKGVIADPSGLLNVRGWTDKKEYKKGEKIKIFLMGNKPFYARVVYEDATGNKIQLLPNPYRTDNYFNGGTIYEIPSGKDKFELEVSPPFGNENIFVYASTSELGGLELSSAGGVYLIKTRSSDIGTKTRGVKIKGKTSLSEDEHVISEFSEARLVLKTRE